MGSSSLDDRILRDYVRRMPLTLALLRAFECRVLKELELLHPAFDLGTATVSPDHAVP